MTTPTNNQEQNAVPAQEQQLSDKELNFSRLKKQLDQERAARIAAEEKLAKQEQANVKPESQEEDFDSNEPYVDHRSLEKKFKRFESQMEKKIEEKAEIKARALLEQEKQQSYVKQNADFQNVLTPENIQKFADAHPAIAERMLRMPDTFDRQALLYEQIKAFNEAKKEAVKPGIQQTIDQNRRGPFYHPTGQGTTPYAQVGDFSPAGQKNAYEKLKELKSRISR